MGLKSDDEYAGKQKPPRKKKKTKAVEADYEDEFEGGGRKVKGLAALSEEERNRIIGEIARFLVFAEGEKTWFSRADISKAVLSEQKLGAALSALLPMAEKKVSDIFGWETVLVPSFTPKGKLEAAGKNDLILRLSPELEAFMAPVRHEMPANPDHIFLMVVLSIIMMHNFNIEEPLLFLQLAKFGFDKDVRIKTFHDKTPVDLIKDLAKAHYLTLAKDTDAGGELMVNIGPRSLLEIGKVNILKFVNAICKTSVDPSALREFTNESEAFIKEPASGEASAVERRAAARAQNGRAEPNGHAEPNGNGHAEPNGHVMEVDETPPAGRPARRPAKSAAATEAEVLVDDGDLPSSSQARTRRRRGQ
jgi:hypothetical protein